MSAFMELMGWLSERDPPTGFMKYGEYSWKLKILVSTELMFLLDVRLS